jgi:hypothetical protein
MRRLSFLIITLSVISTFANAQTKVPSKDVQIKTALLAAPGDKRDSATVYGYAENNDMILLKLRKSSSGSR